LSAKASELDSFWPFLLGLSKDYEQSRKNLGKVAQGRYLVRFMVIHL